MNKRIITGLFLISIIILLSSFALAQTDETKETTETPEIEPISIVTDIKDTSIDYTPYREIVVDEPGVVYHIKLTNTGEREKEYEIVPDFEFIQTIGTYRVDPADKVTLGEGESQTFYFYLTIEKDVGARIEIPVDIRTGVSETTINLVARPIGPFQDGKKSASSWLVTAFKVILIIILVIIIIVALILAFRKVRKKEGEDEEEGEGELDFDKEIETYY